MRIVLINGPPRSGKDTLANLIVGHDVSRVAHCKFAQPLIDHMLDFFFLGEWDRKDLEREKDVPQERLFGRTPREVMIGLSERFYKPMFGSDVFGHLANETVKQWDALHQEGIVFSDSGFMAEATVLVDHWGPGAIRVVRLNRKGCSFDGDSRGFLNADRLGVPVTNIQNDSDTICELQGLASGLFDWLTDEDGQTPDSLRSRSRRSLDRTGSGD